MLLSSLFTRHFPIKSFLLIALIVFFAVNLFWVQKEAFPAQVTLRWDPNSDPDLAGYKIYYGLASRNYQYQADVGMQTTYTIPNLADGKTFYIAATAYDTAGNESSYSNELIFTTGTPQCTYTISPASQVFSASGGTGIVKVSSLQACSWTAISNASWLLITSNSRGSGDGSVNYSVSKNSAATPRSATLTIAGKTFTVTQTSVLSYILTLAKAGTGSGTITSKPTGATFNPGTVVSLTATPDTNSTFSGWSGGCTGTSPTCSLTINANTTVTASFTPKTYTITASAMSNGVISPQGAILVNYGASRNFYIIPHAGYRVLDVKIDGKSQGVLNIYTFSNVTANHKIEVSFSAVNTGG